MTDSGGNPFYQMCGVAAMLAAGLVVAEITVFTIWPLPESIAGYFALFQENQWIGLLDFYLLEFIAYILFVPVFLAIYLALRQDSRGYPALALLLVIVGIAVFLATNNPFTMLSLSNQYAAATSDIDRNLLLAAGQTVLTGTGQRAVGGFNTGFFLVSIAGLIFSMVMLKSRIFPRALAYVGILTFSFSLADYLRVIFLPDNAVLLLTLAIMSGLLILIWLILIGIRLLRIKASDQILIREKVEG